jgi:PAS domain S-box-containing protein
MRVDILYRRLLEQTCDFAIAFLDLDGTVIQWSGGGEFVFGYPRVEVEGKNFSLLFVPEDREGGVDRHEIAVARTAGSAEDDRWMQRKDGSRLWVNGVLTAIKGDEDEVIGYVKVMRNRTDLREQSDELRSQVQALKQALHRKDVFISTLSHELRGPLAPIATALEVLRATRTNDATFEHMLKVIERQMHVLQRLVNDLLDASRLEHGKLTLDLQPLNIKDILAGALEDTREMALRKEHRVELILPHVEMFVKGDRQRLHQVFVNLLTNAIKYTPSHGQIRVHATTEGQEAVTRIEDSGIGIGSDMLPRIFELFTQADSALGLSEGGLGLGLALVRNLVSLHGGSVQVRSEGVGKGSEFIVRLPLVRTSVD